MNPQSTDATDLDVGMNISLNNRKHRMRFPILGAAILLIAVSLMTSIADGATVTLRLVTPVDGTLVPIEDRQALWKAPFGGWVATTWPFGIRVGNEAILEHRSARQALLDRSIGEVMTPGAVDLGDLVEGLLDDDQRIKPEDITRFRLNRPAAADVDVRRGTHTLDPFGIEFRVGDERRLVSDDPRVRIDGEEGRLEVVCHPVSFRTHRDGRTVPAPLRLALGRQSLLGGMRTMLEEADTSGMAAVDRESMLQLTLYLPASLPDAPYIVNGIRFHVGPDGRVSLVAPTDTATTDGREIVLPADATARPAAEPRRIGIRWARADDDARDSVTVGSASATLRGTTGSAAITLDAAGEQAVRIDSLRGQLPAADPRWPHALLFWDGRANVCRLIEMPPLVARPGGSFQVRVTAPIGQPAPLPARWSLILESEDRETSAHAIEVESAGNGVYGGAFPDAPGLWRLRAAPDGPLAGQVLGLALLADDPDTAATLSLFTPRNRGLYRRGDPVELLWTLRTGPESPRRPPEGVTLTLRGPGLSLSRPVALTDGRGGIRASGRLTIETTALPPGDYTVAMEADEAMAGYAARFRIAQREPLSDYQVYSYVYGPAMPFGGSPVNAYYGGIPDSRGLAPLMADGDASMDPAFSVYQDDPVGPVSAKFMRPSSDELTLMALAGQGMHAVLQYPTMLYHEDWNPKHTLPEELAQMRRRLALFVQPMADVAGLGGITMGWYATHNGSWWEDVPCQDGNVGRRNAAAQEWVKTQVEKGVAGVRAWSAILANAWDAYLTDVRELAPGLSAHHAIPSWWLSNPPHYAPYAFETLTHRDSVCYSDYSLTAWGNFRTPAWLNMGNLSGQKLHANFFANTLQNRIVTAFGAAGRGLDGISLPAGGDYPQGEDDALRRIFERFGSWFTALDPLPDVALYSTDINPQNVAMHDLARMRRPAMLLSGDDVLAGALAAYRVLFLVSARTPPSDAIMAEFMKFEANGGIIIKDRSSHDSLPGRDLGFAYAGDQVHGVWGLAYANGEAEFAHLWKNFKETREAFLIDAFANIPGIPVTTPDANVVISPLAGRESILCFAINQTLVPTSVPGRWRQYFVLPTIGELHVEAGWHVHDVLAGEAAAVEPLDGGGVRTPLDFTRMEGGVFLLTRRKPAGMAMSTVRSDSHAVQVTAWLADDADQPLPDPMPFEVTLTGADGTVHFRKFAALGPDLALEVPVPLATDGADLVLTVRDLVLGSTATTTLPPAAPETAVMEVGDDWVGGVGPVRDFIAARDGAVTILLDEGQAELRPAAETLVALLRANGRDTEVAMFDPTAVPPLPLRWVPTEADQALIEQLTNGVGMAWRIDMSNYSVPNKDRSQNIPVFDDPRSGYSEYGPRLRHDRDIVLFGLPETHRVLADLEPWLRRTATPDYPAAGGFFVQHLWSPFRGGYHGLYIGVHDAVGAEAAVAALEELTAKQRGDARPDPGQRARDEAPVVTTGVGGAILENMVKGRFGRAVYDVAFTPGGDRMFVAIGGHGEQLIALTPEGEIVASREAYYRQGGHYQGLQGGLRPVDADQVWINVGGTRYLYSLDDGWLRKAGPPSTGFTYGGTTLSTILEDDPRHRVFLGGAGGMQAVTRDGRLLWSHDDAALRASQSDMLYPRSLFPLAVSGDGRVLLVSGFGLQQVAGGSARPVNFSVTALDTETGAMLWQHPWLLNPGRVLILGDRFLVFDDAGSLHYVRAADGRAAGQPPRIGNVDRMLAVPGRNRLLIVENDHFDRDGPTARVYLRSLDGEADRDLQVAGRVTDARVSDDGGTIIVTTARGETVCFDGDGVRRWRAPTPSGGMARFAPDGQSLLVGARDGVLHWLALADGRLIRSVDLNRFNVTTPERFVAQLDAVGEVPDDPGMTAPRRPPEPSYLQSFDPERVPFGPNLIAPDRWQAAIRPGVPVSDDPAAPAGALGILPPDTAFRLSVEAGRTYLVELLAAGAELTHLTPRTRLEIAIRGARLTLNLPYMGRLPLNRHLTRRRLAFRADETGEIVLTLRAVEPDARGDYAQAVVSDAELLAADLVVAAMAFPGSNLLFDGGPGSGTAPRGALTCTVLPYSGGSHLVRTAPYPCPTAALRMVNGNLKGPDTAWTTEAQGTDVDHATGVIRFERPREISAIVIYEDPSGPVPAGNLPRERTALRYGVFVRMAGRNDWQRIGFVTGNTQRVNIFECPRGDVEEILYLWAGRTVAGHMDGPVRMAEIEAYPVDDLQDLLDFDFSTENNLMDF